MDTYEENNVLKLFCKTKYFIFPLENIFFWEWFDLGKAWLQVAYLINRDREMFDAHHDPNTVYSAADCPRLFFSFYIGSGTSGKSLYSHQR